MSDYIVYEARLLLYSIATGAGLMMVYDLFRIARIFLPHRVFVVGMEDMVYWIYAALMTFSLLYAQNDGELRAYVIAGVFAGMILYDRLVSRFLLKFLKNVRKYLTMKIRSLRREKRH